MIKPWTKVYSSEYLTMDGWLPPTIPTDDFFQFRATSIRCPIPVMPSDLRVQVMFGRKFHYRAFQEWLPFKLKPIDDFIIVTLNKARLIVEPDNHNRFAKSFELVLYPSDVVKLQGCRYKTLHEPLVRRIANRIIFDPADIAANDWRDIYL